MYPVHPHLKEDKIQAAIAEVILLQWLETYKANLPTSLLLTLPRISKQRLENMRKN